MYSNNDEKKTIPKQPGTPGFHDGRYYVRARASRNSRVDFQIILRRYGRADRNRRIASEILRTNEECRQLLDIRRSI